MYFSRNIIFITCLLSGICYSQKHEEEGISFFTPVGAVRNYVTAPIQPKEITKKLAEELLCGDSTGWAANFLNTRTDLKNPCGKGKCIVKDLMYDFDCQCFAGYKFNENYGGLDPRTCVKSKSLVTCKPGSHRVAAEQLIVGQFDKTPASAAGITPVTPLFEWVGGVYERVAGTGYQNTDDEIYNPEKNILQRGHPQPVESHIQQYRHNVPLKGREYYEKYEVDPTTCDTVNLNGKRKVVATLSYNYEENQWQFNSTELATGTSTLRYPDANKQVYARNTKKCVEDVTSWTYTYKNNNRWNVGTVFIRKGINAVPDNEFQIRDMEDNTLEDTRLEGIRDLVYPYFTTLPCTAQPVPNYLTTLFP